MAGNHRSFKAKTSIRTRAVKKTGEATKISVMTDSSLSIQVFIFTALITPTGMAMRMANTPLSSTRVMVVPMRSPIRKPTLCLYW